MLWSASRHALVALVALPLVAGQAVSADSPGGAGASESRRDLDRRGDLSPTTRELISTAEAYRASLDTLLPFHEAALARATEAVERRRELLARGIVSQREVEEAERTRQAAEAKVEDTRAQMAQAETLVAEAVASDTLRRVPPTTTPAPVEGGTAQSRFTFFTGTGAWSLTQTARIERFFVTRFGRPLPVSAYGQTTLHDRLGFDHRDALDVALHPDSPEGRALIAYLRSASISFIAFRSAVPGAATGAHIHIGPASHRLAHVG